MQKFTVAEHKMVRAGGHELLYLIEDNALYEVDAVTNEILKRWHGHQGLTKEEFLASLDDASEEKEGLFNGLLQRQVIVPVGRKGYGERIRETSSFSIPIQTLVLHLTEACNLGCAYCYHSHKSKRTKKKEWMTSEVAEKAVNFLFASSGNLKEVVLVFFGGEPLLNFDLLASVVSYSRKKAAEEGKSIAFALTTNGTLLTPAIISFLNANRIGITISIDGDESLHDRCRPFRNGKPSYQIIVSNLKELLQGAPKVPTVARVTVTKTLAPVSDILDHLLTLGFAEVGFGPVTTNDLDYQLDAKGMEFLLGQFRILSQKFLSAAQEGALLGFSNLIDLLVLLHEGEIKRYSCGAGLGLLSVDPNGQLYLCQRFTGEAQFCVGDIFSGINGTRLASFREKAEIHQRGDCGRCWVRNICAGGCYHEAWVREGSPVRPNGHYCEWIKQWVAMGLEVYSKIAFACPDYLDKLSLLRGHGN